MRFWNDPKFKDLENEWYAKLNDKGFFDIESSDHVYLKDSSLNLFRNRFNRIKYECTVQYYRKARHLLLTYSFPNEYQKRIWELHCEGLSVRQIASIFKIYRKSWINYIIKRIAGNIKT